jgi:hypothetical protein
MATTAVALAASCSLFIREEVVTKVKKTSAEHVFSLTATKSHGVGSAACLCRQVGALACWL